MNDRHTCLFLGMCAEGKHLSKWVDLHKCAYSQLTICSIGPKSGEQNGSFHLEKPRVSASLIAALLQLHGNFHQSGGTEISVVGRKVLLTGRALAKSFVSF